MKDQLEAIVRKELNLPDNAVITRASFQPHFIHRRNMVNNVQYYNAELQKLVHPWKTKITKILDHGCLECRDADFYYCNPIMGYNITSYKLKRIPVSGNWECSCQGYNKRGDCSHLQALYLHLRATGVKLEASLF